VGCQSALCVAERSPPSVRQSCHLLVPALREAA
jgi:hypothetical protein